MSTQPQPLADTPTTPNPGGGPNTEAGKATSSKNAITHGLFAADDVIRPGEEAFYAELAQDVHNDLAPEGALELNLADEIHRAMWRLRRCGLVEGRMKTQAPVDADPDADPIEHESTARLQLSVDRARNQAHRLLHKCTAELRKLQTERQFRNHHFEPGTDISTRGICDLPFVRRNVKACDIAQHRKRKIKATADVDNLLERPAALRARQFVL